MWRDEHTGLYHTHYRIYNPNNVRWLTPDPKGYVDGQNLYRFYGGPNGVDVLGLHKFGPHKKMVETSLSDFWKERKLKKNDEYETLLNGLKAGVTSVDMPDGYFIGGSYWIRDQLSNYCIPVLNGEENLWKFKDVKPSKDKPGSRMYHTHHGVWQYKHFMGDSSKTTPKEIKENAISFIMKLRKSAVSEFQKARKLEYMKAILLDIKSLGHKLTKGEKIFMKSVDEKVKFHLFSGAVFAGKFAHVVHDSFSKSHTKRNPTLDTIEVIYDYKNQDHKEHGIKDLEVSPGAVYSVNDLFNAIEDEIEFKRLLEEEIFKFGDNIKLK